LGRNTYQVVSGLFFSGWDNQAHFTTFANTYVQQSTAWATVDGSMAWNQWYPSLHTTIWSLGQHIVNPGASPDRTQLVAPYVTWTAVSFALCIAALAWMAGDMAERFAKLRDVSMAAAGIVAVAGFAAFGFLGSPTLLFNAGFTNFMMAVTVVTVAGYLSARSWQSARKLGWFLIPLAGVAVSGLWTPLVLALAIPAVLVAIALSRIQIVLGPIWLLLTGAAIGLVAFLQTDAILQAEGGVTTGEFAETIGGVGIGMSAFNIAAAMAFPLVALLAAIALGRERQWPLAIASVGTSIGIAVFLVYAIAGADAADLPRLVSYYVLKTLNALLLTTAPVIAALFATAIVILVKSVGRVMAVTGSIAAALLAVSVFGYVGATPWQFNEGFSAAPGIAAAAERGVAVEDSLIGEAIVNAADSAEPFPKKTTLLWDGSGTLPNRWVGSLHGVLSTNQSRFYNGLPQFPYDEGTVDYVELALNLNPQLDLVILWFRGVSGEQLADLARVRADRVTLQQVPMRSSALCEECDLTIN
jgi:MFS family permease